ncbi:DUF4382 domain-containing protein [Halorussus aquaticus]|uniref:DUF4382 domain-containing protein n=2 Tax=Halorussus aquaticus TaxID=2953748 RepID=A0ABD5Q6E1_9EURY|nr:DUF4382 domain-containing protein [Halorussus aquaticus]
MLLLAGCVGGQGGTTASPTTDDAATTVGETTASGDDTASDDDTASRDGGSTVNFYVSDEKNAMGDFAHLNVTISKVGLKESGGNWTTHDVNDRTVDLTELTGANATRLGTFPVENRTYETVFVHVSEVNGTLTGGEQVRVKLPSEKLQIHQTFSVGANQSVDYVFDISVFKAGKSGKYILKPVISESGTDEEIEDVDEKRDDKKRDDKKEDDENEEDSDEETEDNETVTDAEELNATFVGNVTRGENATVSVTRNGTAVANATVSVNGETVGETAADGTLTVAVPDRKELEVEIETEDGSVELKRTFGGGEQSGQGDGN